MWFPFTSIYPISPAVYPIPFRSFPSKITEPPIPVPIVRHTMDLEPFPAPLQYSPSPAQFTSFSTSHGSENSFSSSFFISVPVYFGIVGPAKAIFPFSGLTTPAVDTQIPFISYLLYSSRILLTSFFTSESIKFSFSVTLVGTVPSMNISPVSLRTPYFIEVPPISTQI